MLREELLEWITSLPSGMDVGIRLGGENFGIEAVDQWDTEEASYGVLHCTTADVRLMLDDWGYSADQVNLILSGEWAGGLPAPKPRSSRARSDVADEID